MQARRQFFAQSSAVFGIAGGALAVGENGPGTLDNSMARERQLLVEWHS